MMTPDHARASLECLNFPKSKRTVRGLAGFLEGADHCARIVHRPDLRRAFPPDLVQVLTGARVTDWAGVRNTA